MESLYRHNIEGVGRVPLVETVAERLRLSLRLERWRDDISSFCGILCGSDLSDWTASSFDSNRFQILLSVQYYGTKLLLNGPVLAGFLMEWRLEHRSARELDAALESSAVAIKDACDAAQELQAIISAVNSSAPNFLDCNAAWWTCNFISEYLEGS